VKLRHTLRGAAGLDKVLVTIEARSPRGAHKVQARIQAIVNLLLEHPHAGQLTSKGRLRRVVASPYPYLISITRPGMSSLFMGCVTAPAVHHPCRSEGWPPMAKRGYRRTAKASARE
jgi:toxin ParE1/3/4